MNKKVKIIGLDCPNCAKTLEKEIAKINGIEKVEINFVKAELEFSSKDINKSLEKIIKLTKKLEPQAEIIDEENQSKNYTNNSAKKSEHKSCHEDLCDETIKHSNCCHEHKHNDDCCHESQTHEKSSKNKSIILDFVMLFFGLFLGILSPVIKSSLLVHYCLLISSVLVIGYKVYIKALRLVFRGVINENLLLTISVIGAIAIHKDMEAVMVIALYSVGKILEGLAVGKARKSIEKITNFKPQYAVVIRDTEEIRLNPSEVEIGETIVIRPGECIPIDAEIIEGSTNLNMQSLTGESLPVFVKTGDKVLSGAIVMDGVVHAKTMALYKDSTVSKILNLIENNQQKKSKTETIISKITKWYTLGVIAFACLTFGIVYLLTSNFQTALYRGLIFLVVSCPCAFAISVPLSYFSGLGNASSKGILIKGSVYLDASARIKTVAFDKTGTLTTGKFVIEKIVIEDKNLKEEDVLFLAGIGEQYSLHPLAKSITESACKKLPKAKNVKEISGEGLYFEYNKKQYFVGRKSKKLEQTCVELFEEDKCLAKIYLHDNIKPTSIQEIETLNKMGIKTVLLSGDKKNIVEKMAKELGVSEYKSELLPQDKSEWIESQKGKGCLAFVGDGLNDAPSLTISDVGFCMGLEGNSASIEASDIVLSDDNPNKISRAIKISKFTRKIVWQNISFSAIIKLTFLCLGAFGITGMLSAVIADVGVTVLAVLNSLRALNYKDK